ncbi:hypothetical protein ES706_06286 [subsurface metagenome]|nr:hypothetical protein [Hadesarchaea archaeon]
MLLLCLAQAPLLSLNLGSKPASAQAEQDLLWNHDTSNRVLSVSISSDGNYIAAGGRDNKVYLFSRTDNTPLWIYDTDGWIYSVSISSDGNYIAAGGYGKVYLFSRTDNTPLRSCQTGGIESISISSDGNYIAAGGAYGIHCIHFFSRGAESISGASLLAVIAVIVIGCSVMIYELRQHQRLSVKRRGKRGA